MNIGYASLTVGVEEANFRTCRMKDASKENLREIISHNLSSLDRIIDYNTKNDISLFRISSDIIPFGSSPANELAWWEVFADELKSIGDKAKEAGMRLSMHPGQYTVLNSLDEDVVSRAVDDLAYHTRFLDALGLDSSSKIILHIGGVYGDKQAALARFKKNYLKLDESIKARLVIENDKIQFLEIEWSKYKYNILEHSPASYMEIRQLLKDKSSYPVLEFYKIIDESLAQDIEIKNGINGAQHVWGYFKDQASEGEKKKFLSYLASYERGTYSIKAIKGLLHKMAVKYEEDYLLSSFYFDF